MRVLVMLMWSGILCLHSIASSVEAVHPSSSTKSQQQQLVDRISQHRLPTISSSASASASSDQTSLQPLDSDDTEIVKSQSIDDDTRTFLETDSEDRGREKDNNWTGYAALVLPDFESSGEAGDSTMGKTDADVEKRVWKGSGKLGQKESGKRKWSSTNLAMWGKRKWAASNMAMWGKRHLVQPEKRKWNGNSMAMWGKRDSVQGEFTEPEWQRVVRGWSGNNLAMWGKRDIAKKLSH